MLHVLTMVFDILQTLLQNNGNLDAAFGDQTVQRCSKLTLGVSNLQSETLILDRYKSMYIYVYIHV